jgi:hypothetical protein
MYLISTQEIMYEDTAFMIALPSGTLNGKFAGARRGSDMVPAKAIVHEETSPVVLLKSSDKGLTRYSFPNELMSPTTMREKRPRNTWGTDRQSAVRHTWKT